MENNALKLFNALIENNPVKLSGQALEDATAEIERYNSEHGESDDEKGIFMLRINNDRTADLHINHIDHILYDVPLGEIMLPAEESEPLDPDYLPGFTLMIKPTPINKEVRDLFVNMGCNMERCGDAEILNFNSGAGTPPPIFIYEPAEESASSN